jgi:hypothetical protein
MIVAYETGYIALNTIKNWFEIFFNEDLFIEDNSGPERLINQESIKIVYYCLEDIPNMSTCAISQHSNIHKTTVISIFTDVLLRKRVSWKWIPNSLTDNQKWW